MLYKSLCLTITAGLILLPACVCAVTGEKQELSFFEFFISLQNKKNFFIPGFCIFSRECAGKSATRKTCFPSLESMSWRRISNQMNILNQSKQSAFSFIFLSCFHFFPAFFKLINFFIYYLKSGQKNFINKFNKAMKKRTELESSPNTLTAGLDCRMMHGRLIDQTDRTGSCAGFPLKKSLALKSVVWITKKMLPPKMQVV